MAYTTPATPPTAMAETFPRFAGSPKNRIPDAATGSLFVSSFLIHVDDLPLKVLAD